MSTIIEAQSRSTTQARWRLANPIQLRFLVEGQPGNATTRVEIEGIGTYNILTILGNRQLDPISLDTSQEVKQILLTDSKLFRLAVTKTNDQKS